MAPEKKYNWILYPFYLLHEDHVITFNLQMNAILKVKFLNKPKLAKSIIF